MSKTFFQDFMKTHKNEVLVIPIRGTYYIYEIPRLAKMMDDSGVIKSEEIKQAYLDVKELGGNYKYLFHLLVTTYLNIDRE
ncbi:hypothetical protein [Priestia megaterium]|uniref:hypothetical protein n=1 Tax=Priestia megaterium TaxID=1404 RepID=UPI0012B8C873|nr:hypothetical protein [Priestia megaterium]